MATEHFAFHRLDGLYLLHFCDKLHILGFVTLLAYHTLHQLTVVRHIYERARVNLFNLGPLYAFSDLSGRSAIGLLAFVNAFYVLIPELLSNPFSLGLGVFFVGVSLLAFVWPLLGTHNLLVDEKNRLLGETSKLLEAAITELNRRISSKEVQGMDDWHKAMASLEIEHTALSRISTWPWQTETLRSVVAALVFPLIIWLIQRFLQGALNA